MTASLTPSSPTRYPIIDWEQATKSSPFKRKRKLLSPQETPSIYVKGSAHDCSEVNPVTTEMKVSNRFLCSMARFGLAHTWGCTTIRGKTHYNGARSHCGHCEAAHASLSPTLYDNILQIVQDRIYRIGYQNLQEKERAYVKIKLNLTAKDEQELSSELPEARLRYLETTIASCLTPQEQMGSLIHTVTEKMRNTTFENPKGSNRVDSYLEIRLRLLEDQLADACKEQDKLPKEALRELHATYQALLAPLKDRLFADQQRLFILHDAWTRYTKCHAELLQMAQGKPAIQFLQSAENLKAWERYVESAKHYQDASSKRFQHAGQGVPHFYSLRHTLAKNGHLAALSQMARINPPQTPEQALQPILALPALPDLEEVFQSAHTEIDERIQETQAQLAFVEKSFEEIHECMKETCGHKDAAQALRTPTKEYFAQQHLAALSKPMQARKRIHLNF